jgi:hypothetical protein
MPHFERRFVRPSRFQVVDALIQAAESAGAGLSEVAELRECLEGFVPELRQQPEGFHRWDFRNSLRGSKGVVTLGWWTDHLQRRHFRIWAGGSDDEIGDESDLWPAAWHLAPEQVFERNRHGERSWLAVCACGMAGTLEAIGWTGDRCGCCHYKPLEAPAEAPVRFTALRDALQPLERLAFSPDGRWLAGICRGDDVHLWDIAGGGYHRLARTNKSDVLTLTFTPDSSHLAFASSDRLLHFIRIPTGEEVAAYPTPPDVTNVTIAPDNLTLAVGALRSLEVWGRPDRELPWLPTYVREAKVCSAAFNLQGSRLAVGFESEVEVMGIIERAGRPYLCKLGSMSAGPGPLAFSRDERTVVVGLRKKKVVVCWEFDRNVNTSSHWLGFKPARGAISSDSEWLAGLQESAVVIEHVRGARPRVRLQSNNRPLVALAFSPDGQTLATADKDGSVKLWPWRRLIEA